MKRTMSIIFVLALAGSLQGCLAAMPMLATGAASIAGNAAIMGTRNKSKCEQAKVRIKHWPKIEQEKYLMNKGCPI